MTVDDRPTALSQALTHHQLQSAPCISVLGAEHTTLLLVEAPEVEPSELKAAIRWRIKDLIDFHIDDAVIDVFDIEGQQERGRQKMMYVVVARIATIREHIDLLEGAGITLQAIDIAELAQRNVAALLPEDASGVALLHFGARRGLLTLTRRGSLFLARGLDFGSDQMAAELPEEPQTGGLTLAADEDGLSPRLHRMFDGIVLEVQRSLDYYESHFGLPPVSAVVLAPTATSVPGLLGYLANNLGLPVRMLDLNTALDCSTPLSDALQAQCLPAIGAALRREKRAL